MAVGHQGGDQFLHAVGVLVFVNHYFLVAASDGKGGRRGEEDCLFRREIGIVPVQENVQGIMFHVIEVHEPFLLFPFLQGLGEIQGEAGKDGDRRQHGAGFFKPLLFRNPHKGGYMLLPGFLCFIPKGFDGFRFRRLGEIGGFGKMVGLCLGFRHTLQPVKGKVRQGEPVLPALHGSQGGKVGVLIAQLGAVHRLGGRARLHDCKHLAVGIHDFFGKGNELVQHRPIPGEVIHGSPFGNPVMGGEAGHPVIGEREGAGKMENAEDHFLQPVILVPVGKKIHRVQKTGVSLFIPVLQHGGKHFILQKELLIFIGENPHLRV